MTIGQEMGLDIAQLLDLHRNIHASLTRLGQLIERYHGDVALGLMAYHASPDQVDQWAARHPSTQDIPPAATLAFPGQVMRWLNPPVAENASSLVASSIPQEGKADTALSQASLIGLAGQVSNLVTTHPLFLSFLQARTVASPSSLSTRPYGDSYAALPYLSQAQQLTQHLQTTYQQLQQAHPALGFVGQNNALLTNPSTAAVPPATINQNNIFNVNQAPDLDGLSQQVQQLIQQQLQQHHQELTTAWSDVMMA